MTLRVFLDLVELEELDHVPGIVLRFDLAALERVVDAREIHDVNLGAEQP